MVDRELEVTGVAADTGEVIEKRYTDEGVEDFAEQARQRAGVMKGFTATGEAQDLLTQSMQTGMSLSRPDVPAGAYTGPLRVDTQNGWTVDDRAVLKARLWETVPSLYGNEAETSTVMDRIVRNADANEFLDLLYEDASKALAQTDDEYVAAKMLQIEASRSETTAGRLLDAALMSAMAQHAEREYPLIAMGRIRRDENIIANEFSQANMPVGDVARATGATGDELERLLQSDELRDVLARDGVWKVDDRRLVVTYEDDAGPQSAMVWLDEGTRINTDIDAMAALVQAKNGTAHRLELDDVEGKRNVFGVAARKLADTIQFVERATPYASEIFKPSDEHLEAVGREVTDQKVQSGTAAAEIYRDLAAANPGMAPEGIYAAAAEIAQSDEYADLSSEEVYEQARQRAEEEGSWVPFLQEEVLPRAVTFLETYDKWVHQIGLTLLAVPDAIENGFDGDAETTFQSAFSDAYENEYVSEFFGIDPMSGWGATVNLGASVLFDPITWVTPGGKASWAWMKEVMTNPAMAARWVRTPQFRSAVRHAVNGNDMRLGLTLANTFDDPARALRVLEITAENTPKAERAARAAELADIFTAEIKTGNFLPAGPRSVVQVKNVQGMTAGLSNFGKMGQAAQDRFATLWVRGSKDRGMSLGDDFAQRALDAAIMRHGNDTDRVVATWKAALEAQASTQASPIDDIAVLQAKVQELDNAERAAKRALGSDPDVAAIAPKRQFLEDLDRMIAESDMTGVLPKVDELDVPGGAGAQLDETIFDLRDRIRAEVELYGDQFDELTGNVSAAYKEKAKLLDEIEAMRNPKDRRALEQWWHEFYDEWADEIGVPQIEGTENPITKRPLYDWQEVTGDKKPPRFGDVSDESWYAGYVGDEQAHADIVKGLEQVGVGPQRTVTIMPASPMEMLAYRHGSKSTLAKLWKAKGGSKTLDQVQNVFASTVLLNLNTPVKTHGDEILRFMQDVGFTRESVLRANFLDRSGMGARARRYAREGSTPSASRMRKWEMVDPSKRGQWSAAERFVNGTMVRDEVVQRYARAVVTNDRRPFTTWWNSEGHQLFGKTQSGRVMTADEAYGAIDRGVQLFLSRSARNPKFKKEMRDEVLQAIVEGRPVRPRNVGMAEAEFWRRFPPVPGQLNKSEKWWDVFDRGFDLLYGKPSDRRGGVIFQHYYDFARNTLLERHQRNGAKILMDVSGSDEAERLVRLGYAKNIDQAYEIVSQGRRNPRVMEMLRQGWKLESDIESAAASYAKASADAMMYQMGAVSIGGKRIARVYPWGRAQFDYIGYWSKKLLEPTQFQLQAGTRGVGRTFTPSTRVVTKGGRQVVPELNQVNLRLVDRIAHMATVGVPNADNQGEAGPKYVLDTWTFLPTSLDEDFIIENTLSPGPIPSWMVNFIPEEDDGTWRGKLAPLRQAFETIHPSHAIFNDYTNGSDNWLSNLATAIVPNSSRSLRRIAGELYGAIGASVFGANPEAVYTFLTGQSEPPFYRDQLTIRWGDWLTDNAFDPSSHVFSTSPGSSWASTAETIRNDATRAAYSRTALESIRKNVGLPSYLGEEALYAKYYLPIDNYLDEWVANEWVTEGQADNFRLAAEIVGTELQSNEGVDTRIDVKNRNEFADVATDILFSQIPQEELDRFIVENPGVAVNMTSWIEVVEDRVPDKWKDYVSGGKIEADGETRRDMYRDGFDQGWIVPRDRGEWEEAVQMSLYRSARNTLKNIYETDLGVDWARRSKDLLGIRITPPADEWAQREALFDRLNMTVPDEWRNDDGTVTMTVGEYKDWLSDARDRFGTTFTMDPDATRKLANTQTGRTLLDDIDVMDDAVRELELDRPLDLRDVNPEAYEDVMERFRGQVATNPNFTVGDYNRWFADQYGPLDYKEPEPPDTGSLDFKVEGAPSRFTVVDGDTIEYIGSDGEPVPFRLVGINAPEKYQEGGLEATRRLRQLLDNAQTVTIGMFDRDRYGDTQTFFTREGGTTVRRERVFGWLYVDGQPVWFPEVFSPDNPRGAPVGGPGEVPDYTKWLGDV